ncbi:FAD-dependent oxidoreductase (plasmid) [Cupriavidus sp. P-10]|uniref:dihydrolipoyl dehydrogenase family protein n=1 Tax=Cupriavidus sp. P-10 TaxID=2027911 RepID=UPI000E2FED63|nr:FAD-dependent oxidoreductase [Cupriavidus sp. P-10]BDB29201.1 FAD-dependent oxidoreductase [Cupriavidus sp. P-10]
MLEPSERYAAAQHQFGEHGILFKELSVDLRRLLGHKESVVDDLGKGIDYLFKKNGVTRLVCRGRLIDPQTVEVALSGRAEVRRVQGRCIVIATGPHSASLPGIQVDERRIISSTGALSFDRVPDHLVVIGAGYIDLVLGSVWRRLGAEVTVVEYLDRITPDMDGELAAQLHKALQRKGFKFRLGQKVLAARLEQDHVALEIEPAADDPREALTADRVLVAVGRRPHTEGLGLDARGVRADPNGQILVDKGFRTSVEGVYVIGGAMLAHKASEEGIALLEQLAGQHRHLNYNAIPAVIYTWPEVGSVGQTEEMLKEATTRRCWRWSFGRRPKTSPWLVMRIPRCRRRSRRPPSQSRAAPCMCDNLGEARACRRIERTSSASAAPSHCVWPWCP